MQPTCRQVPPNLSRNCSTAATSRTRAAKAAVMSRPAANNRHIVNRLCAVSQPRGDSIPGRANFKRLLPLTV